MNKSIQRGLTLRYMMALGFVACVMITSYALLARQIAMNEGYAYTINISGMQRMLSQRIALLTHEMNMAQTPQEAEVDYIEMQNVVARMQDNHKKLMQKIRGDEGLNRWSQEIQDQYLGRNGVDAQVTDFLSRSQGFINQYDMQSPQNEESKARGAAIVKLARGNLLTALDNVVSSYEKEVGVKIEEFKRTEILVLLVGLLTLIAEALFIFWPMARNISRNVEELRHTNAELLEFSYRISHDIKAPVMSSMGLINLLDMSLEDNNPDAAQKTLGHLKKSLYTLDALIDDIINLMAMKHHKVSAEPVDLTVLIQESLDSLSHLPHYDELTITVDVQIENFVIIQKLFLKQTLENLLSNAIKYYDENVPSPSVHLSASVKDKNCVIIIEDNGLGIPEECHADVFGMFKRFHPRKSFGSGLGLYLTKQNMKEIGGEIEFVPLDQGSRFVISFPLVIS